MELCRYIVLNPVRAAMVRSAVEWPWSSYRATAGYERDLKALNVDWILAAFAERRDRAVESYEQFVADGKNQPSPWESLKNQVYLGSDQFVDDMQRRIEGAERLSEIPTSQRRPLAKPLQFYVDSASSRNEAICLAYASGGYRLKEIGDFFGLHYSRVSRIIREAKHKTPAFRPTPAFGIYPGIYFQCAGCLMRSVAIFSSVYAGSMRLFIFV